MPRVAAEVIPPADCTTVGIEIVGTAAGSLLVGYNRGKKGGFVRVLISRDSVLQYGADGKCNVSVSFTNASFENIKNWNTTLSITQDLLS